MERVSDRINPLVVEESMSVEEAKDADPHGKGGGLVDGEVVRAFPQPGKGARRSASASAAELRN